MIWRLTSRLFNWVSIKSPFLPPSDLFCKFWSAQSILWIELPLGDECQQNSWTAKTLLRVQRGIFPKKIISCVKSNNAEKGNLTKLEISKRWLWLVPLDENRKFLNSNEGRWKVEIRDFLRSYNKIFRTFSIISIFFSIMT